MNTEDLLAMLEKYPELADTLEKAYAKAEAKAKSEKLRKAIQPLRTAAQTFVSQNLEPGWQGRIVVEIGDFATSPEVRVLQRFENGDKTSYKRIFATAISKNGKRGGKVTVIQEDHKLYGQIFDNTGALAKALGLEEHQYGPYNALRQAKYLRGKFWDYVKEDSSDTDNKADKTDKSK